MKTKEFLNNVCEEIKYKPANKTISEELEGHIKDIKNEYLCKGYSEEVAEEKGVEQMGDAKEIGKRLNKIHKPKLDWKLLILIMILICFAVFIQNDGMYRTYNIFSIFFLIAISLLIYFYDYRKLNRHSLKLYIIATLINVVSCILGYRSYGAVHGGLPFVSAAPTVISIPLYVIAFAGFINNIIKSLDKNIKSNLVKTVALSIISIISLLMINTESGLIVVMAYLIISTVELIKRKKIKYIFMLWVVSIITFLTLSSVGEKLIYTEANRNTIIETYSEDRIVDENSNFAFSYLLDNYGMVVGIGMVLAVMTLNVKLIINATKVEDSYGKLINISIATIFILETVFNLAMNLGFGKITNFTIPLVAKGKTSFAVNMMCLSLALSVYRRKNINFEEPAEGTKLSKVLLKLYKFSRKFEENFSKTSAS